MGRSPRRRRGGVISFLNAVLRAWLRPRGGFVLGSGTKLGVLPTRGRIPDLCAFFAKRKPPAFGASRIPPDIIVEVITPTPRDRRRDRITKVDEYARFGVRFHWIVDPETRTLEIFELGADGRYVRALGASEGSVGAPGCDDLTIDLDAMWSEVDELLRE